MKLEQFIDEWAGKDWKTREWNADEIGGIQYDKLTYFLTHNTGYVWIDKEKSAQASGSLDTETKFQGIAQWLAD